MRDRVWSWHRHNPSISPLKRNKDEERDGGEKEGNMYKLRRIDLAAIGGVRNERGDKRETGRDGRKLGAAE